MIEKIISNYSPKLSNFSSAAKNVCCNRSAASKYKDAIRQYLDIANSRQAVTDAFISAFSCNPEVFGHPVAGNAVFDTAENYAYEISEEAYELLMSMFENDQISNVLTFTDSSANPYSFIKSPSDLLVDGYQCIISSQTHPTSIKDMVLYRSQDGKYIFNPLIRVAEFFDGEVAASVSVSNVSDAVNTICNVADVYGGSDIYGQLVALGEKFSYFDGTDDTITGRIQQFVSFLGLTPTGEIADIVNMFHDIVIAMLELSSFRRVKTVSIYGLVSDLVVNNEIIDVIRTTYDNIVNGDLSQLVTSIKTYVESKTSVVKSFANSVILGFSKNGVVGALSAITDLISKLFSSQPDSYAVFNTAGSIPQAFSAGFVDIVTGIASSLFQILSACMHPVLSIIGAVGYGVVSTIKNIVGANVSEEYARVDNLDESENIAPYAIYGQKLSVESHSSLLQLTVLNDNKQQVTLRSLLDWTTLNGNPVLTINWYGVIIKIAYSDPVIDESGSLSASHFIVNVFPTVCNTEQYIFDDSLESSIIDIMSHPNSYNLDSFGVGSLDYSNWQSLANRVLRQVYSRIQQARFESNIDFTPTIINDQDGEYAGYVYSSDSYCRRQVFKNVLIFWALTWSIDDSLSWYYTSGSTDVSTSVINLRPTVSMDGDCVPFLEVVFGSVSHGLSVLGTFDGHIICLSNDSSSFESLGKTCASMQEVSLLAVVACMVRSLFNERWLTIYNTNANRPSISCASGYKDVPYFIAPRYTRGSVITSIIVGAIIAVTTIAVVAITTYAVKRKIQKQQALRQARVEAAWSQLTENPSGENYRNYRRTVKANNRFTKIFGGSKYDYVNYWNGDVSERESSLSSFETITSFFNSNSATTEDLPVNSVSALIRLITGQDIS